MGFYRGPKLVTDGLVLMLDAANPKSFISGSTTWNDLSGNKYHGTLVNDPAFDSSNNGSLLFDGINDYVVLTANGSNNLYAWTADNSIGSSTLCMEIWFKTNDAAGRLISKPWNGSGQYNISVTPTGFSLLAGLTGTTSATVGFTSVANNSWRQLVIWANSTQMGYYLDGGLTQNTISHGITGGIVSSGNIGAQLGIGTLYFYGSGWVGNTAFSINGNFSIFRRYDRILTAQEVLQNYNANKSRYGL